jgi:hypothetical protein
VDVQFPSSVSSLAQDFIMSVSQHERCSSDLCSSSRWFRQNACLSIKCRITHGLPSTPAPTNDAVLYNGPMACYPVVVLLYSLTTGPSSEMCWNSSVKDVY